MKFIGGLVLALIGTTASASACTDGAAMKYYFFDRPPAERAEGEVLPVRIVAIDGDVVRAELGETLSKALGRDAVTIDLPAYPLGANCITYGLTSGPAFVVVKQLIQRESEVRIVAVPVKGQYDTRRRRSRAELDRYVVDPALKEALAKDRRVQ